MLNGDRQFLVCCCLAAALSVGAGAQASAQIEGSPVAIPQPQAAPPTTSNAASPAPVFFHLFQDTVRDFKRLPSRDTLNWLGIGATAALIARTEDVRVIRGLSGSRGLDETFEAGQIVGGARFQVAGALGTYTLGRITGSPRIASVGGDLLRAQILAQAMTSAIKMSVRRTRPDGTSFSLPSGHASVSFASATVLQRHFGWKAGIPAYAVASYVAASRIQTKRHFLSDVAFGAALGIVAGRTVTIGHGRAQMAVAPMAAPGGGGIAFTWIGKR